MSNKKEPENFLLKKRFFILDGDGTMYLWDKPLPGANELLKKLKKNGKDFVIISNNDSKSKVTRLKELRRMLNFNLDQRNLLLPNEQVIAYLKKEKIRRFYGLITASFRKELQKEGFVYDSKSPSIVIIGFDTELTYEKLKTAILLIRSGVKFILTHIDPLCPYKNGGEIPDAGSIISLVEKATSKEPVKTFGKPYKDIIRYALSSRNSSKKDSVIIGDRINTDIRMANENGMDSILLTKGRKVEKSHYKPTFTIKSIKEVSDLL